MRYHAALAKLPALLILISNVARAGSQWVLIWLYAFLGGAAAVGEYSLALAVATPIFIASEMSLRNVYVTLRRPIAFTSYLIVRVVSTSVALATALALAGIGVVSLAVLVVIALIKAADSIADLSYGVLQKEGRLTSIALNSIANSVFTVLFGVCIYWASRSIELSLIGSLAASAVSAAIVFGPVFRRRPGIDRTPGAPVGVIRDILRAGVPSGLAFASVSLLTYVPVYFLGVVAGKQAVGTFAVLAYFLVFANLFYASVQQSTLHSFVAAQLTSGTSGLFRYALRIGRVLILFGALSGALVLAFGAQFLLLIYGDEFSLSQAEIMPIAASLVLIPLTYISGAVLLTKNLYSVQLVIGLLSLGATVGIGFAIVEDFDLAAAGVLVLVGTALRGVLGASAAAFVICSNWRDSASS